MTRHRQLRSRAHRRSMRTRSRALSAQADSIRDAQRVHAALPRCVGGGKIRYATQREADHTLHALDRTNPARREKNSYRCTTCDGWHLTSWTLEEHENYLAVTSGSGALHHRVHPATDYLPAAEFIRAPRDLSSIVAASAMIPTPADVAARIAPTPLRATAPEPLPTAEIPSTRTASPTHPRTTATSAMPPSRVVPSPAEVAARTVPIKRAEAARRQAELASTAAATATRYQPTIATTRSRNLLRAMLRHLMRRLRRS